MKRDELTHSEQHFVTVDGDIVTIFTNFWTISTLWKATIWLLSNVVS